uniref:G-protein coupled receptors family 1 profile domain-containing protein n=1 Tax=Ascaris lumbricoides TaxID=6252 RepID=A0A9J2P6L3_ASCLU
MHSENRVRYSKSPEYDLYGRRLWYGNVKYDPQARITIPRPSHFGGFRETFNTEVEAVSSASVAVNMTPDEDAVDRVTNEFRFLDDRPVGSSVGTDQSTRQSSRDLLSSRVYPEKHSRKKYAFCLFACFLQVTVAIALLAFAAFRLRRIFERPSRIVNFERPQEDDISTESASLASILSGSSLLVPALLHIVAAITAAWPMLPNFSSSLQILYIISSSLSIIFWLNGIFAIAFELNLYYIQLSESYNSFMYRAYIFLLTVASIDVLLIPTLGIVYAAYEHTSSANQKRCLFHSIASLLSVLFSATAVFLSVPCLFFTARNLRQWSAVNNAVSFHLFGLRELIISSYSLVVSVIGFTITLSTSRRLRFGVVILYSVCLLVVLTYVVNGERIFSIVENLRALEAIHLDGTLIPVTPLLLMSMYIFIWLMALSHATNIAITVVAIHRSKRANKCSAADKLPPYLQFHQRSLT